MKLADDQHLTPTGIWLKRQVLKLTRAWSTIYEILTSRTNTPSGRDRKKEGGPSRFRNLEDRS